MFNKIYKEANSQNIMKILITGGLGFIGSNLAEKCVEEGHEVTLLTRTNAKKRNIRGLEGKVNLILKDIKDINDEVRGMDYVFHLASIVHNQNVSEDPIKDVEVNCDGTLALLEACKKHNKQTRIVYGSTFFVNGNLKNLPATPDSPCNPLGIYPATRLAGEHFCRIYNEVFGMNSVVARFTNVFGVREQRNNIKKAAFNRMINTAIQGGEIQLYNNGVTKRDYIYVSDVVDACLILAEKGEKGEIYYVGRGEGVRLKDLVSMVIEETGGGTVSSSQAYPKVRGIGDFYCDNTPLKKMGWKPKISIREGIKRIIDFYRKEEDIKSL